MARIIDRRSSAGRVRRAERFSTYFDFDQFPEKAEYKVTRIELLAILQRHYDIMESQRWYRRLWRWLLSPFHSPQNVGADSSEGQTEGKADGGAPGGKAV